MEVRTDDGWILRGERRGRTEARAVAVLGHGMMVDRRTLDRPRGRGLASRLAERGFEVLLFDARGHGESGPSARDGARWDYDDIVRFDVPAMVKAGRQLANGRPLAMVGHSLIGHAALIAAGLYPSGAPDALVAYAPNLWAPHLEPSRSMRRLKGATLVGWELAAKARGFFDPAPFGLGRQTEASPYITQFLSMWRADRLASATVDYEHALARAELPVLAYASENDRVFARPASVARFLGLAASATVNLRVLRGPSAPDHIGFLTDPRSDALWDETATWMTNNLTG